MLTDQKIFNIVTAPSVLTRSAMMGHFSRGLKRDVIKSFNEELHKLISTCVHWSVSKISLTVFHHYNCMHNKQ